MTTFAEMQTAVYDITKRPELVAVTKSAIKLAAMRAHHVDFFYRDQALHAFSYNVNAATPILDVTTLFEAQPLFRAMEYVQGIEFATGLPAENFEYREFSDFYTAENVLRTSVYTILGTVIKFVPANQTGQLRILFYKNPNTAEATFSSWIADLYPDEVAMWAAAIIWARTGNMEQAKSTLQLHVLPFKELLVTTHLHPAVN